MQITVLDDDGAISLGYADLLKYAGPANVIASALMLRVSACAFALLSPQALVWRRALTWRLGFPGPGIMDCVEMISHAVRDGRCLSDPDMPSEGAPKSVLGHFIFKVGYRGRVATIIPSGAVFDDEFRAQVEKWQEARESPQEREHYLNYKEGKVRQIMDMPDAELFRAWLAAE